MYEHLTLFLPMFDKETYGEWNVDKENDGSAEHPFQMPFVNYSAFVEKLHEAIYEFQDEHPDFKLNRYYEILEKHNIKWGYGLHTIG